MRAHSLIPSANVASTEIETFEAEVMADGGCAGSSSRTMDTPEVHLILQAGGKPCRGSARPLDCAGAE